MVSALVIGCAQTTETGPSITFPKPLAPTGLRVDSSVGSTIDLIWQPTSEADLAGYMVYRSTTSGSGYTKIATVKIGTAYWDTGTSIATTDSSAWLLHIPGTGVVVYPTPFNPLTENANIQYVLTQNADADLVVYNSLGNIVWNRSFSAGSTGGMAGGNVIFWDGKNNSAQILSNGIYPIRMSSNLTNEADYTLVWDGQSGLSTGSTYYYVVTAFNTYEVESEYSNEASAEARIDGITHWPVRIVPGTELDPVYEYDSTLPNYR